MATIADIFDEVSNTINDTGLRWFTSVDIYNSIQDQYNKLVALLCPIEKSTIIPIQASPYYNLSGQIKDYMYTSAIYNPNGNYWLRFCSYKQWQQFWPTFQAIGNPRYFNVIDFRRNLIWPYPNPQSGVLYIIFKAKAPTISDSHIPVLPYSLANQLLEYSTTADLLEQAREFTKATKWWDRLLKPQNGKTRSILAQAKLEIKALSRNDREAVLEPWRWLFHAGGGVPLSWINDESPSGTINGVNSIFTIANTPNPANSLILVRNGQTMFDGEAYTLVGSTITFNTNFIPQAGDVLRAWYQLG